jgi:general secretion pathway protein L
MKTNRPEWPNSLRPAVNAFQAQWHASVFPRFFNWWAQELRACLPPRLRRLFERSEHEQIIRWQDDEAWLEAPEGTRLLSKDDLSHSERCVLLLSSRQALIKTITLPAAAAQDVAAAVAFEMDRHTPFKANQVYYAVRRWPSRPKQPINVTLVTLLRDRLDRLLEQLRSRGIQPDEIDIQTAEGTRLGINLLPAGYRQPRKNPRHQLNMGLAILAAVLIFAAMQLWLHNRSVALEKMRQEVNQLRADAREIEDLRQQIQNGLGATRYLTERKTNTPPLSVMLSELTQCLPKDTWLTELSVEGDGQVNLAGQSQKAGALIGEMKNCRSLTGAQFQGVIQPDETTKKERFYLLAHLRREEASNATANDTP